MWYQVVCAVGKRLTKRFMADTSGAITVDFVVIVAAIVSLGLAVAVGVSQQTMAVTAQTSGQIAKAPDLIEIDDSGAGDDSAQADNSEPTQAEKRAQRRAERQARREARKAAREARRAARRAARNQG